jgi:hypothetical protein
LPVVVTLPPSVLLPVTVNWAVLVIAAPVWIASAAALLLSSARLLPAPLAPPCRSILLAPALSVTLPRAAPAGVDLVAARGDVGAERQPVAPVRVTVPPLSGR